MNQTETGMGQHRGISDASVLLMLVAFAFVCLFQITTREPIFNDEFINLARTEIGFTDLWGNILDYSLRPLYRVMNQLWRELFGPSLTGMWLGSVTIAIFGAAMLQMLALSFQSRLAAMAAPLVLASTPEFVRVGLGNMPQLASGVFAVASLYFLLAWLRDRDVIDPQPWRSRWMAVFAALFGAFALLTHPTQLAYVVGLAAVMGGTVMATFFFEGRSAGRPTRATVFDVTIAGSVFLGLIALLDILYRVTLSGTPEPRLLPGSDYSYINLWRGNSSAMDTVLASYGKPFGFYWSQIAIHHSDFMMLTLVLAFLSSGLLFWRWRTGESDRRDFISLVPFLIVLIWLVLSSVPSMKTKYTLAALAPLAAASNVVLVAHLANQLRLDTRARVKAAAAVLVVIAGWTISNLSEQRADFEVVAQRSAPILGAPYRLVLGLPAGPMAVLQLSSLIPDDANTMRIRRIQRFCNNLAAATQRTPVDIVINPGSTAKNLLEMAQLPSLICYPSELISRDLDFFKRLKIEFGYRKAMITKKGGLELWFRPQPDQDQKSDDVGKAARLVPGGVVENAADVEGHASR